MKKQQVLYIHGGNAYSDYEKFLNNLRTMEPRDLPGSESKSRWSHSFREDLGEDFEVFMPLMPNKQNAKYEEWKIWFERHFEYLNSEVILVGVSLGGIFLAKYLSENNLPFKTRAVYLLAAPYKGFESEYSGEDGGDFNFSSSDLVNVPDKVDKIYIMHSKDDFAVPYEHALMYKEALPSAELVTFADKNHFLITEFPELLKRIKSL